jgi:hemoglobin-like flavoprotein
MNDAHLLQDTLERVVARIGDPAPRVFARLFAESPELQPLFLNDAAGSVRAEMFLRALECLQDAASAERYGAALVGAEHQTHLGYGVPTAQFQRFFVLIVDEFRAALGADWTPAIDAAWARGLQRLAQAVG